MEPLELEFTVACDTARASSLWTEQTTRWWPRGHSVSAEPGLTVTFEPRPGGRVRIEHRGWERLGAVAEERRDRNRRGWAGVTEHYRRVAMSFGTSAD